MVALTVVETVVRTVTLAVALAVVITLAFTVAQTVVETVALSVQRTLALIQKIPVELTDGIGLVITVALKKIKTEP